MPLLSSVSLAACARRVPGPDYDRRAVRVGMVHLGVGGFHRSHQAVYHDELLRQGELDWGICGVGVLPGDRWMRDALQAQDGLYTLLVKHPDGTIEPRIVGALVERLLAPEDPDGVIERLAAPATRVVSMTITEGGYNVDEATGAFVASHPGVLHDLSHPEAPRTVFGLVVEALRRRRERGVPPPIVLSCDNLVDNGGVARHAFGAFAGLRDPELGAWVQDAVPFPSSVVDRITPATAEADRAWLAQTHGIEDRVPVVCEPFTQWVLEDPGGSTRPPWEAAGAVVLGDVRPHELMKLRLL
ncbi:MAG: Mannitol 2-dehydrogenase, partial [Solirubrobacterales bacterium]|nr:Mannitol 2-dehydrogenase [Solirubrobacterales bacterium]